MSKIPTFSICNLLGADNCATEFLITRVSDYMDQGPDLQFPHRHTFFQIVLFTEGAGEHSIDFVKFKVVPHQVYALGPGQIHSWNFEPGTDGFIINFDASFFTAICHNANFIQKFALFNSLSDSPAKILEAECCGVVHKLMDRMWEEYKQDKDFKDDLLRGMLMEVLVLLSRQLPKEVPQEVSHHQRTVYRKFEQLIEAYFREKRLPRDYAELLFITPNHLNALVNSVVGKPAGELIRDRVILEAKRLLVNSDSNISEVAYSLNFDDNAYFTRFFKKYTGTAPEVFRQNYANKGAVEVEAS